MAGSINFFSASNTTDPSLRIFSHVPLEQRIGWNTVCKDWNALLNKNLLWEPILQDFSPREYEQQKGKTVTLGFKAVVNAFFINTRPDIQFIFDLIKDDGQLAKCLGTNQWTLEEFNRKSSFERSRLLWKAMHQDATPVLVTLLENVLPALVEHFNKKVTPVLSQNVRLRQFNDLDQFNNTEKFTPIVVSLIDEHECLFDTSEVICALLPISKIHPRAKALLIGFIKSHTDLSALKEKSFRLQGLGTAPVLPTLLPICEKLEGITLQDLIACKLKDPIADYTELQ